MGLGRKPFFTGWIFLVKIDGKIAETGGSHEISPLYQPFSAKNQQTLHPLRLCQLVKSTVSTRSSYHLPVDSGIRTVEVGTHTKKTCVA